MINSGLKQADWSEGLSLVIEFNQFAQQQNRLHWFSKEQNKLPFFKNESFNYLFKPHWFTEQSHHCMILAYDQQFFFSFDFVGNTYIGEAKIEKLTGNILSEM